MKRYFTDPESIHLLAARTALVTVVVTLLTAGAVANPKSATKHKTLKSTETQNLDASASACSDFYQYANGGWLKMHPGDGPPWSVADILTGKNNNDLRDILDHVPMDAEFGTNEQKLRDYFATCKDQSAIDTEKLDRLQPEFDRILSIANLADLQVEIGRLHATGFPVLFEIGAKLDRSRREEVIVSAGQGPLGLPDRDYYLKDDIRSQGIRDLYTKYIQTLLIVAGDPEEKAMAESLTIVSLEKKLAASSLTRTERGDITRTYHRMTLAQAGQMTPTFAWSQYLEALKISPTNDINVNAPDFFRAVDRELTATPIEDWKTYLRFQIINAVAPSLSSPLADTSFAFYGEVLGGKAKQEKLSREERCVEETRDALGGSIEQIYSEQALSPDATTKARALAKHIVEAFRDGIDSIPWMDKATKARARAKLEALQIDIGYPKEWPDYEELTVGSDSYLQNILNARAFAMRKDLQQIGQPFQSNEWGISAAAVNAFYNPARNQIVFPAGFLQPPFFDATRDDAYNYGAAGSLIAHELMHGFDDQGSKFDGQGNPNDWWTPEDRTKFGEQIYGCVEKQFASQDFPASDTYTDSRRVVRESIADLAGLELAFQAYRTLNPNYKHDEKDGQTAARRFFIGYAQSWASHTPTRIKRLQATTDPHPLDEFRVKAPLSNMPEFAKAFECTQKDKMVRPSKKACRILTPQK